jgi:hypothetical protein
MSAKGILFWTILGRTQEDLEICGLAVPAIGGLHSNNLL